MGRPKVCRILAYSTVISSTFWAPPHISAHRATVARSSTRLSGCHPPPTSPMTASAPTVTFVSVTSQSLRVWSMVGRSVTWSPGVPFGSRNRVIPSSAVFPDEVRAATTIASAVWASCTKSLVPDSVKRPPLWAAPSVTPCGPRLQDREAPEEDGREVGAGHHGAPHLLHEDHQVHEPEPHPAVLLGRDQAEPTLLGQLGPEGGVHGLGPVHQGADLYRRALVLEELAGGAAQQVLLFAEAEVHGVTLSAGRARARQ